MVRLVDHLSAEGLVERRNDPADRRVNRLHITEKGRKRVRELDSFKEEMGAELFEGFTEAEILRLLDSFDALHANLKTMQAADAATTKLRKSGT